MATAQVIKKTQRGLGRSDSSTLEQMFPANPLPTYDTLAAQQDVVDGDTAGNEDYGTVSMDYVGAPELTNPENQVDQPFAFQPNLSAPGPGSINPADKPAPPDTQPLAASGMGSTNQPSNSAASIASQKIGELIFGRSQGT